MNASKNRLDSSKTNIRKASHFVRARVEHYRGKSVGIAIRRTALDFRISQNLAWRLWYRQTIPELSDYQLEQIQRAYLRSLDYEIAEMEQLTEGLRSIRSNLETQFRNETTCSSQSNSAKNVGRKPLFATI